MKKTTKLMCINAMGIALFVAISLCLQVPVFQNYYLCLGYIVMTVYCYAIGVTSGTIVGTLGVVLYCIAIGGLRGMPGWALGNLVLGIMMGITFKIVRKMNRPILEMIISSIVAVLGCAIGILLIKSGVECIIYSLPFWIRVATNIYAFVADVFVIIISIPICRYVAPKLKAIIEK